MYWSNNNVTKDIDKKAIFVYTGKLHASKSFWKIYPLKQLVANISPVINVKAFLPVIVVNILQIDTIEYNMAY